MRRKKQGLHGQLDELHEAGTRDRRFPDDGRLPQAHRVLLAGRHVPDDERCFKRP
jgi:hypothetical protein